MLMPPAATRRTIRYGPKNCPGTPGSESRALFRASHCKAVEFHAVQLSRAAASNELTDACRRSSPPQAPARKADCSAGGNSAAEWNNSSTRPGSGCESESGDFTLQPSFGEVPIAFHGAQREIQHASDFR